MLDVIEQNGAEFRDDAFQRSFGRIEVISPFRKLFLKVNFILVSDALTLRFDCLFGSYSFRTGREP